ncbi:MAG: hypothetical protein ABSA75_04990 [Candidatus Bathyarchaeia archaeon]|jgi:hypothetical protein
MANITIEYMILVPFLILQIFLLPYATSIVMNYWSTSSETLALNDASIHIGTSIQQLYFFLNNPSVSSGTVTNDLGIPPYIGNNAYTGNATLTSVSGSGSGTVLKLTLQLKGKTISITSPFTLGQNARWSTNSTFMSNSPSAYINAYKDSNNTIWLSFNS